ncbi:thiol reductant ABC exporter subunit CydD [Glutamicibacter uratoxydans]|uniref:Thiol reductant ABC exporter subunit CydD n=1 Tax=Glutamicibacter uratoxydans TaxID=43667 RepID=A0A4Y4DTK5_GLUUR|nr:ATP-binding cassette domain-containing protein [Glutamicibacter uratoxydans]GED07224.1 thiol reductant ABC exporter subunit CydD [Glutamicibacter uratoxydans]
MRRVFGLFSASTALVVVLSLVSAASAAGLSVLAGRAVDLLAANAPLDAGWYWGAAGELATIALCALLIPIIIARTSGYMTKHQRERLMHHYLSIGPLAVRRVGEGELVHTAMDMVDRSVKYRSAFMGPAIAAVATPLLVLLFIGMVVDPVSAGLLLIPTALVPVIVIGFQKLFSGSSGAYRRAQGILTATFLDALRSLGMLKLNGGGSWMGQRIAAASERVRQQVMKLLARNQLVLLVIDASFAVLLLSTAAALAWWRSNTGAITTGEAVCLVILSFLMLAPVNYVGSFFYIGMTGKAAEQKIAEIKSLPFHQSVANPLDVDLRARGLVLENICASYDGEHRALHKISATFPAGSRTAIIGASGSGKTTLLRVLQGQLEASEGTISDGRMGMGPATLKGKSAVVEQNAILFSLSLRENLQLAAPKASDEQMIHALQQAGLGAWLGDNPGERLEEKLGESGARLSGGQAQRLAIARALLVDRPLLLLDEPSSALDVQTEEEVLKTLRSLDSSVTVITVTHRLGLLRDYDRVIVMDEGQIIQSGQLAELLETPGYLKNAMADFQTRAHQLSGTATAGEQQ